jgi:nucleoid DNA-binding protein
MILKKNKKMDKAKLIEKIAKHFGVSDSEQKLFFEVFLRRCSQVLNQNEQVKIGEIGIIEFRGTQDEDSIVIFTNEGEEFVFGIPEEVREINSIDSYFSISIGKPVIPLRGEGDSEFFIPHTGNEIKKMFGLKVERFIDDARKPEPEVDESDLDLSEEIPRVDFSFKNWKSASYSDTAESEQVEEETHVDEEIEEQAVDNSEQEIHDELSEGEKVSLETSEEQEKFSDEIEGKALGESGDAENELETEGESIEPLKAGSIEEEGEKEFIDVDKEESGGSKDQITNEEYTQVQSDLNVEKKDKKILDISQEENIVEDDSQALGDAFRFVEGKNARIESYRKRSYTGFIFAVILLVVVGVVIYLSYYLPDTDSSISNQQSVNPREFAVSVERSYEIPVTYPYEKGMLGEVYNAIDKDIINSSGQKTGETVSLKDDIPEGIEIRNPLPANRIKGYIYKYENMYAVQVSSWKSRSIAISETQKFLSAGFDAFIEKTELADKGVYYRVRVGGFNSLEEAEEFLKK